jgi:long-subunit acyl-CoA synthetase (AMP-forming)
MVHLKSKGSKIKNVTNKIADNFGLSLKVTVTNKRLANERNKRNYRKEETVVRGTFVEVKYRQKPPETPKKIQ